MKLGKNGGDPTARRRRDPEQALKDAREIIRRHGQRQSIREIARALGLPRTSVHRVVQEYRAAQQRQRPGWMAGDERDDAEFGALVSQYEGGLSCSDVRSAEDVMALGDLERFRSDHLPADHPAKGWVVGEAGYRELAGDWATRPRGAARQSPESVEALSWRDRADW
jgi:IclR helix-turn-helix domain